MVLECLSVAATSTLFCGVGAPHRAYSAGLQPHPLSRKDRHRDRQSYILLFEGFLSFRYGKAGIDKNPVLHVVTRRGVEKDQVYR